MKIRSIALAAALALLALGARADYLIPQPTSGPTVTVSAFSCLVGKVCPTHVNINSAGTEVATASNPLRVDPTGTTTQPVNCVTGCSGGSTFGAAFPSTGSAVGMSQGGNLTALTGTAGNLNVQCANCSGSGASALDQATFTAGSSVLAPGGGFFQTTATSNPLTTGQQGMFQVTAQRALFTNLRNASGTEVATASNPLQVSLANTAANGTALFVTGAGGTFPVTQSGTWTVQPGNTANTTPWLATISQGGNSAAVTAASALKVDGSAVTQAVSGTVTANQGGTWTVQPGNTANTTAWLVTGTGGVFPASQSGSWTVAATQSGTWNVSQATASNLNATVVGAGTAGAASGGVVTVQGVASMTPLLVTPAANSSVNLAQVNGVTTLAGAGASGTGAQRVTASQDTTTIAGSAPGTAGAASANVLTIQGVASMTAVQVSQATAANLNATVVGTGTLAVQAAQSGTWNVTNISGTISLPTGASTAANQTSVIGTAAAGTAATNSQLVGGVYNSTPLTLTNTQQSSVQLDASGFLKVNVAAGGGAGGTSSTFGAAFPGTGTAAGMSQGGNMVALTGTANNLNVQCANCSGSGVSAADEAAFTAGASLLAAGGGFFQTTATSNALTSGQQGMFQVTANRALFTNLRNAAGAEVGVAAVPLQVSLANTAANGTAVSVSGTVTANAGTNLNTSALALETGGNLATLAGAVTASVMQSNTKQVNGVTTLAGAGAVGTGAQRVAVGQDTTTIAGSAPGTAGSASANVVTVQGVASMTPFLTNPGTAGNWGIAGTSAAAPGNAVQVGMAQGGNLIALTGTSGNLNVNCQVGCSSSGGSSLADEATFTQGSTSFTVSGGIYSTSITNLTSGQGGAAQVTADRFLKVAPGLTTSTLSTWTTATAQNTTQILSVNGNTGAGAILLQLDSTTSTTITAGAVTIQGTFDGTNWVTLPAANVVNPTSATLAQLANPYTVVVANQPFLVFSGGFQSIRINLTTALTASSAGSVSVIPYVALLPYQPTEAQYLALIYGAVSGPLATQSAGNVIGGVGVPSWAGGTLGAMANYGTSPGAVLVPGVNAFVTNTVAANVAQVNGVTTLTGTGAVGTGAQRVAVGTDTATIAGSAPGTAGTASANVVTVQGVASMTPVLANPGTAANWAVGATGSAVPANAIYQGTIARSSEPSATTTGNLTGMYADLTGKVVVSPYANRENMVRGAASATTTGATTVIAASGSASLKTYITDLECARSDAGTTAIFLTFNDVGGTGSGTIFILPNNGGGGGNNKTFNVPLVTAANTAFTFTASSATTTVYCSAQGFTGY